MFFIIIVLTTKAVVVCKWLLYPASIVYRQLLGDFNKSIHYFANLLLVIHSLIIVPVVV